MLEDEIKRTLAQHVVGEIKDLSVESILQNIRSNPTVKAADIDPLHPDIIRVLLKEPIDHVDLKVTLPEQIQIKDMPFVLEGDDGIRPAGPPDACFYCKRKIGERHEWNCVVIEKTVELNCHFKFPVLFALDPDHPHVVKGEHIDDVDIEMTGKFVTDVPFFWSEADINFRYGMSSWCADNLCTDKGFILDPDCSKEMFADIVNEISLRAGCLCEFVMCEFSKVVHPGPLQKKPRLRVVKDC